MTITVTSLATSKNHTTGKVYEVVEVWFNSHKLMVAM
jgi:hypothetical protein